MTNVKMSYEQLNGAATSLLNGKIDLETQLTTLRTQIQNLVSNDFVTDNASQAYDETYQQFTTSATKTISALEGFAQLLRDTATDFQNLDQSTANRARTY